MHSYFERNPKLPPNETFFILGPQGSQLMGFMHVEFFTSNLAFYILPEHIKKQTLFGHSFSRRMKITDEGVDLMGAQIRFSFPVKVIDVDNESVSFYSKDQYRNKLNENSFSIIRHWGCEFLIKPSAPLILREKLKVGCDV